MEIIETTFYTKYIVDLLSDEEYKKLQQFLVDFPKAGALIKGSGGLRKLRWNYQDKGKSGGIRNIYYYYEGKDTIFMIYVYKKGRQDNLSPKELNILKSVLKELV